MGGTCSAHGDTKNGETTLMWSLKGGDYLENQEVERKIILKWVLGEWSWRV
jgi:hypothetical protein